MKTKILALCLILFSLIGYLEWGGENHNFIFQIEADVISKLFTDFLSILHPFVLIPLIGQILLATTFFLKKPKKLFIYLGIGGISLLFLMMLFIGLMLPNFKIILCTCPFLITSVITILHVRKLD